jgi:lysophospholipase L1-like esterase
MTARSIASSIARALGQSASGSGSDGGSSLPGTLLAQYVAGIGETFNGTQQLTAWEDQSGNGHTATQTGDSGPADETASTARVIWDVLKSRPVLCNWGASAGWMQVPTSLTVDFRNVVCLAVGRRDNPATRVSGSIRMTGPFGFSTTHMMYHETDRMVIWNPGTNPHAGVSHYAMPTSPTVIGFRGAADGTDFVFGTRITSSATALPVGTSNVCKIGQGISTSFGYDHQLYEVVYLQDCSQADLQTWANHLQTKWGGAAKNRSLVIVGDSIIAGFSTASSYPTVGELLSDVYPNAHIASNAITGQDIVATGADDVVNQIMWCAPLLSGATATGEASHPLTARICLIAGGTNDIDAAVSAANIKTGLTTRVTEAKAYGATHVAICTIPASVTFDAGEQTVRDTVNADILDLGSGIGHDIAINLHETSGGGDDRFDDHTSNIFSDGTHLNSTGVLLQSQIIEAALDPYLDPG